MTNKELEEAIYEYGDTMKHIGRCETDGKTGMKEYNKLISTKEKLMEKFDLHFKSSIKVSRTLHIA
jgi:hypothetical protein